MKVGISNTLISNPIDSIVQQGIQIKMNSNLNIMPKVIKHNKIIHINPRESTIKGNVGNNDPKNNPPKFL